jgi:glycosyltransferase involved in cell wall biosynthesis
MKILLFNSYFNPEITAGGHLGASRNMAFAREGFEMLVITPTPSRGLTKELRDKYKRIKYEELLNGRLIVHRFSMFAEGENTVLRAVRYLLCNISHLYHGLRTKNVDVLFAASTPPTQGAMAALIKKIKKIPLVYNLQDIFPDSLVGTGLARQESLLWKIGRFIEDFTYRNADKIIVISEDFKKNIMAKGVPASKIEVVYNWIDENAVQPVLPENNRLYGELVLKRGDFHVVYAGNLGHAQNIEIIIRAADALRGCEDIKFIIFGTGGLEKPLKKTAQKLGLGNLFFFPLQPPDRISEVYSLGDISIVSCQPGQGMSAMPSKTWSIMSSGTAVLASFDEDSELQRIIEDNRVGLFCPAGDVEAFAGAVIKLSGNPKLCAEFGQNGRRFILNNLTRDVGTSKYVEVIRSVVNKQPGGS